MIGIPVAWAVANAAEWWIHKHVLHGSGKRKGSFWSFHWHDHHRHARRNDHLDPDYARSLLGWNAQTKEALGLVGLAVAHLPLLPVAPCYTGTIWYCVARYYSVHKRAHLDTAWARAHLPWHYDHHMGPDQDCNWCVTHPWFDTVMGTRVPYLGTPRAAQDEARRTARREARAARATQDARAASA